MNNGISKEVISQFDKISELPDCWDHNQQYQKHLLSKINTTQGVALDISCGTGEFTKNSHHCSQKLLVLTYPRR